MAVKGIRSVANSLSVIEVLSEHPGSGVTAIATSLGLDKMAVQRILVTLSESGWIRNDGTGRGHWELAPRVTRIGRQVASDLRQQARVHLEQLAADTQETVLLWGLDDERAVVLDAVDSPHPLRMTVPIGTEVRILEDELGALLDDPETGEPHAGPGYAVLADAYPSSIAVIAPVQGGHGRAVASLTVVAPRTRMTPEQADAIGPQLVRIARLISLAATLP